MKKKINYIQYIGTALLLIYGIVKTCYVYAVLWMDPYSNSAPPYVAFIYLILYAFYALVFFIVMALIKKYIIDKKLN